MNLNIRKCVAALLLFLSLSVSTNAFAGWTSWYGISQVYTYSDGGMYMMLDPYTAHGNPDNCISSVWLRVGPNQANVKDVYQMALTAKASGRKVNVYVDGCQDNYTRILHMRMGN